MSKPTKNPPQGAKKSSLKSNIGKAKAGDPGKSANKKPDLNIKKQYPGVITGGTKRGLKKHGYKLASSKTKSGGSVLKGKDPNGKTAVFVDNSVKSHRSVSKKAGMKTQGKDVDHVQAKTTIRSKSGVFSRLQTLKPGPNRSESKAVRSTTAKMKDGVFTASKSTIRKINGHKQEKPMAAKPKRGDLRERFGGYAKNAEKNLAKNSKPKASAKKTAASRKMLRK